MRNLFQLLLFTFICIFVFSFVEPYLSFRYLATRFEMEYSIVWLLFILAAVLSLFVVFSFCRVSFCKGTNPFNKGCHQMLFSLSVSIVIHYTVSGDSPDHQDDVLFALLYSAAIIYFILLFFLVVNWIEELSKHRTKEQRKSQLVNDDPISNEAQDFLEQSDFVENITKQILHYDDKIVFGLYGAWGTGKSSILNLIQEKLPSTQAVVHFKPWYFGENNQEIIPTFLKMLAKKVDEQHGFQSELKKLLLDYADGLRQVTVRSNGLSVKLGDILNKFVGKERNLTEIKDAIFEQLDESNDTIIVFIDEIDRLSPEEIQTLFKLIRLICDFPKVIYVLALDEEVVSKSLGMLHKTVEVNEKRILEIGRGYLEKFIQVPLYIPKNDYLRIKKEFLPKIEMLLQEHRIQSNFLSEVDSNIYPYLTSDNWSGTIRNFKRYLNLVNFYIPFLKEEVFVDDLLYLLYLNVFVPELYEYIRENPSIFTMDSKKETEETKKVREYLQKFKKVELVVRRLFPYSAIYFGYPNRPGKAKPELTNSHIPISNPKDFNKYFMYQVPYQEISEKELGRLLYDLTRYDVEVGLKTLHSFEELYGVNEIFNKLSRNVERIEKNAIDRIVQVFVQRYLELDHFSVRYQIIRMLVELFKGNPEQFLSSTLMNNRQKSLYLSLSIGNEVAKYSHHTSEIEERLNQLLKYEFKESSIQSVFSTLTRGERQSLFILWIKKEEDLSLKQKKINVYVIDKRHHFEELLQYIYAELYNSDRYIMLLWILENFGVSLIRNYLVKYEGAEDLFEDKDMLSIVNETFNNVFDYLKTELTSNLEKAKKENTDVEINLTVKRLLDLLQKDQTYEKEMQSINALVEEIDFYNKQRLRS